MFSLVSRCSPHEKQVIFFPFPRLSLFTFLFLWNTTLDLSVSSLDLLSRFSSKDTGIQQMQLLGDQESILTYRKFFFEGNYGFPLLNMASSVLVIQY